MLFLGITEPSFIIGILLAALVGMTIHEFAHNYVAHIMGDPTPSERGLLTLDPSKHIYWPGFIMFVVIGFGILGTAPVSHRRMRNPRWGYLAAVAAGPLSGLLVALVAGIAYRIINPAWGTLAFDLMFTMVYLNVWLFFFNILPLFPLDGWHIILTLLPPELAYKWRDWAQNTQFIFLALILISFALPEFSLLGIMLREPLQAITELIMGRKLWA